MITLVLGGARSGKSAVAERLAAASGFDNRCTVTYVATMVVGNDASLAERVARHRERRPAEWATVEAGADLPAVLETVSGTVLLDSLGPWLALHGRDSGSESDSAPHSFRADTPALCAALSRRAGDTVVVSDEVGLGVIPATALGGAFRDALGSLNQTVAAVADRVLLVVAGRVLALDPAPER